MYQKIFTQIHNVERDIKAILDGYKTKIQHDFWEADALQKDAIQNSWDAKKDSKGKDWKCLFSLRDLGDKKFLSILDEGTKGLIGTQFNDRKELSKILLSEKEKEDLAYFCNSNWSVKKGEKGGTRGRGKTIFLGVSKDKKIFFDSLRSSDNRYVFGKIYLDKDKEVKFELFWDEDAKSRLVNVSNKKIVPLKKFGTRILILNPISSVIKAIEKGDFLGFINNSRWEIIKKFEAKIFVDDGITMKSAILPRWYENNIEDVKEKEYSLETIKENTPYRIKRLILRYPLNNDLPDSIRGVAIQRSGMTIQRLLAEDLVREEGTKNIYGWVEMDRDPLEKEMKSQCEGPEHFDFSWQIKPANYLRNYIRSRIREFAKDLKLIESEQAKKNKIQKLAEEKASKNLAPLFKKLGLSGKHKGGKKKRKSSERGKDKPLRLSVSDFDLPHENGRVNYGEEIKGAYVIPINDFDRGFMILVRVFVVSDDGKTKVIKERQINLYPGRGPEIGVELMNIEKKDYKKGGYCFKARMVSLEDTDRELPDKNKTKIEKGTILYEVSQKFYVEIDPPESGPFRFHPKPREDKNNLFEWEAEDSGGYIIYYNELHPKIEPLLEDKEKLSDYFTEQGALLAIQITFEELIADDDNRDKDFSQLIQSKNLSSVLPLFLRKYSEFLWDYLEK